MYSNVKFAEEDKPILSSMGFDVAACIGRGAYGFVFNGICNSSALKLYPIHANEAQKEPENVVHVQNKPHKEVGLHGKTFALKTITREYDVVRSSFHAEANIMKDLRE